MTPHYSVQDLINTAAILRTLRSDLTDMMNDLCEEWIEEVKSISLRVRNNENIEQSEIDSMVEWHNEICEEEAYPSLLPIQKDNNVTLPSDVNHEDRSYDDVGEIMV